MSTSRGDESAHDVLPLLGGISWRLIQVALVVVGAAVVFRATTWHSNDPKWKSYVASMKSDLRNLVTAEESYFADNGTFTTTVGNLGYSVSAGNTVTIGSATGTGWAATAKNNGTSLTCGIFVGTAPPPIPGLEGQLDGEPRCK